MWQAFLQQNLGISVHDQDYQLLKVRDQASALEISMASKHMSRMLHPDKNRFMEWVQDTNEEHIIPSGTIDKARLMMGEVWKLWNETKENLIEWDQGILQKAGPTSVHKAKVSDCMWPCACSGKYHSMNASTCMCTCPCIDMCMDISASMSMCRCLCVFLLGKCHLQCGACVFGLSVMALDMLVLCRASRTSWPR